jgi:uncharacterized repeat protein (TIGR01451 family)
MLLIFLDQPSIASTGLSISSPTSVEADLAFSCTVYINDASTIPGQDISLLLTIPQGFSYAGGSVLNFSGSASGLEPSTSDGKIAWNLSQAIARCRNGNHLVINEFEQDPLGPDTGNEWVEISNPTPYGVNIGGWWLKDSYYNRIISLPPKIISPGGHYVAAWSMGSLTNGNPMSIGLYNTLGMEIDRTRDVTDTSNSDLCWARRPDGHDRDGDSDWMFQASTRGASNDGPMKLTFYLVAESGSQSGSSLGAGLTFAGGSLQATSSPITVIEPPPPTSLSLDISSPSIVESDLAFSCTVYVNDASAIPGKRISLALSSTSEFSYAGGSVLNFSGSASGLEPSTSDGKIVWDLSPIIAKCRNGNHLVINEFEQDPPGIDTGNEWVEISNPTPYGVNIGGWWLKDSYYNRIQSLPSVIISPGGRYVAVWGPGSLTNGNPMSIILYSPSGLERDRTVAVTDIANSNLCWARRPDGRDTDADSDWGFHASTKGASNDGPLVLTFDLIARDGAKSGSSLGIDLIYPSGSLHAKSAPITLIEPRPPACLSLNLSEPKEMSICKPGQFSMKICNGGAKVRNLVANIYLPVGFSYSAGSSTLLSGVVLNREPLVSDGKLTWDLSAAMKTSRHVVINEIEQNPSGSDTDKEWVELYNPTLSSVSVGGWWLEDSHYGRRVVLPAGLSIPQGGYLPVTWSNGALINTNPTRITLCDPSGRVVDSSLPAKDDANDDLAWARVPDGNDRDRDSDWRFQASTRGFGNGGDASDLFPGECMELHFSLAAGCEAENGQRVVAALSCNGRSFPVRSSPVMLGDVRLNITLQPDIYEAAIGDQAIWTLYLKNEGNSTAYDLNLGCIFSPNLHFVESDSPSKKLSWQYPKIDPGESAPPVHLRSKLTYSGMSSCQANASWGCSLPCQRSNASAILGAKTALRKLPDEPRAFTIGDLVSYEVHADFPKTSAHDLWINDTVPVGLIYNESSLSVSGSDLKRSIIVPGDPGSGPARLCWFLGDVRLGQSVVIRYNARVASTQDVQDGLVLGDMATMTYINSSGEFVLDSDEPGTVTVVEPDLSIEKSVFPDTAGSGDRLTYTIALCHSGESHVKACQVEVADLLPEGLTLIPESARIVSGPPGSVDLGPPLKWRFEELGLDWNRANKIIVRYNATLNEVPGEDIINNTASVTWSSSPEAGLGRDGSGGENDYIRNASSSVEVILLSIAAEDSPDPVNAGEILRYALIYENRGKRAVRNVTIEDELDPKVSFLSSNPAPSEGCIWRLPLLEPDGPHRIDISVRVNDGILNGTRLANRFRIWSQESGPSEGVIYTDVLSGPKLAVNKTALQKSVYRGEEVSYKIEICNTGGLTTSNVVARDIFDSGVEIISASPALDGDGTWHLGSIAPGECIYLDLTVRVPEPDIMFQMDHGSSGTGYLNLAGDYSTSFQPYLLGNCIYVSSSGASQASDCASVAVLGHPGTKLQTRIHGSGVSRREEEIRYLSKNKSIELKESTQALEKATILLLPGGRRTYISSGLGLSVRGKNEVTGAYFYQSFSQIGEINCSRRISLDENRSNLSLTSSFQGIGRLGFLKHADLKRGSAVQSGELYAGNFQISESIDDYGSNLALDRGAQGRGYVDVSRRIKSSQKSTESGSGSYSAEEKLRTFESYIYKDIDAEYRPVYLEPEISGINLSAKWGSAVWSSGGEGSLLGEEFSDSESLHLESTAGGLNDLYTSSNFTGKSRLRSVQKGRAELDISLAGCFTATRKVITTGVSRYDRPHLHVLKSCEPIKNSTAIRCTIRASNDGNRALGPVYIRDLFPDGTEFINSSLRPVKVTTQWANWTVTYLPIGETSVIDLLLNVTDQGTDLVNRAQVAGGFDGSWTLASNFSTIERSWLSCYTPASWASKSAVVDQSDPYQVTYRISVTNTAKGPASARVDDALPCGLVLLRSSLEPEVQSGRMVWVLEDIAPGETKAIEYSARARESGTFVNQAQVEMISADGVLEGLADLTAIASLGEPLLERSKDDDPEKGCESCGDLESDDPCACQIYDPSLGSA